MWTLTKWALSAVVAVPLLAVSARADEPDPESAPRKVTPSRLRTMLDNMGYDATESKPEKGPPTFNVKIQRDGWTYSVQIGFSPDRGTLWLMAKLREVPAGGQIPPTVVRKLLEQQGSVLGRTFFSIQNDWFYLNRPESVIGLTPKLLRQSIDQLCSQIHETQSMWDPAKWPKPRGARAGADDDPPAEGRKRTVKRGGRKEDE